MSVENKEVGVLPWWGVEGARPVIAWSPGQQWSFQFGNTEVVEARTWPPTSEVGAVGFFPFVLNDEQIIIVTQLMHKGKFLFGRYETWEQFCLAHGLDNR